MEETQKNNTFSEVPSEARKYYRYDNEMAGEQIAINEARELPAINSDRTWYL